MHSLKLLRSRFAFAVAGIFYFASFSVTFAHSFPAGKDEPNGGLLAIQALNLISIAPTSVCQGGVITIDYNATGFPGGTTFTAQLSAANGTFPASPTFLGNLGPSPTNVVIPTSVTAGAGYKVRIRASDGSVSNTLNLIVKRLPNPFITGDPELSICGGSPNTLTAHPTTNVITYSWKLNSGAVGGNTNSLIANLAGTYTVTVDSLGCTKTSPNAVVTNQPPANAVINGPANVVVCKDGANAIPTILYANSGPGLSYQWQRNGVNIFPNGTNDSLLITSAGSYTVTVTIISSGCKAVSNPVVATESQNPPVPNAGTDVALCSEAAVPIGFAPGAAYAGLVFNWVPTAGILPNANTPNANISLTNTGINPVSFFYDLIAVNPATGCSSKDQVKVTVNPNPKDPPFTSAGEDLSVCENGTPVALAGFPSNTQPTSTPVIRGEWQGAGLSGTANPNTFTPNAALIGANNLKFTVYYDWKNGGEECKNEDERVITVVAAPIVQAGDPKTFCNGIDSIQLTGFTPAYPTGIWSGEGISPKGMFYPKAFQGIPPAGVVKKCTLTAKGPGPLFCTAFATRDITVTPKQAAKAYSGVGTSQYSQFVCSNLAAFQMQGFSPAGGKWTSSTINISQGGALTFTANQAGIHKLKYTYEKDGCKSVDSVSLTVITAPDVELGANDSICANDPPRQLLGATPPGGKWKGQGVDTSGSIFTPTPALAGPRVLTYKISMNGCADSAVRIMFVKTAPIVNAGLNDTICASVDSLKMTGFSPAIGKWKRANSGPGMDSNGVFRPKKFGLIGNFVVVYTVTGSNGCSSRDEKQITVNQLPAAIAGLDTAMCSGDILKIGGATLPNVRYNWFEPVPNTISDDTIASPTLSISNLQSRADTFFVRLLVTDTLTKCINRDTSRIIVYPRPTSIAIFPGTKTKCYGDTFVLKAKTKQGLTYEWLRNGLSINVPSQADSVLRTPSSGKYQLVVRNVGAVCTDTSLSDSLSVFPRFVPLVKGIPRFCKDSTTQLYIQPQNEGFTYEWQYNGQIVPDSIKPTFTIGKTGTIRAILRTDKGCRDSSAIVSIDSLPFPTTGILNDTIICENQLATFKVPTDSLYNYRWIDSATRAVISTDDTLITGAVGKYYVEVYNFCRTALDSVELLRINPLPRFGILDNGRLDTIVCVDLPVKLFGPAGYRFYEWTSDTAAGATGRQYVLKTDEIESYALALKIIDQFGCSNSDTITVHVQECAPVVYVPTAFSPNNDGINEVWRVTGYDVQEFKLFVYNRWGQMVFYTENIDRGWDGRFQGTVCPSGAYKWVVEYKGDLDGEEVTKKEIGSVTIIR